MIPRGPVILAWLVPCLVLGSASADGGRIAWTGERDGSRSAIVVAPLAPRIGTVRIDWIGRMDEDAHVVASHDETGFRVREPIVRVGDEGHALLELSLDGRWSIDVVPSREAAADPIRIPIEVGPAMPGWRSQWPWMFAWVPMVGVGLAAAVRRGRAS